MSKERGISLASILRARKRGEKIAPTGDEEVDQIVGAILSDSRDLLDFVTKDSLGNEIRFWFLGPGNLKMVPGKKVTNKLAHRACPKCGKQSPVIVLVSGEKTFFGRTSGQLITRTITKKATIHCGHLQTFDKL